MKGEMMKRDVRFEIKMLKRLAEEHCYNIKINWTGKVRMWQEFDFVDNDYTYESTSLALLDWYDIMVISQKEFGDWGEELEYIESVLLNKAIA